MYFTRGGYCALRRSHHIFGWHWLWSPDLRRWVHYQPIAPRKGFFRAALHKVWYEGRVVRGDR